MRASQHQDTITVHMVIHTVGFVFLFYHHIIEIFHSGLQITNIQILERTGVGIFLRECQECIRLKTILDQESLHRIRTQPVSIIRIIPFNSHRHGP